jgi:hypothetical protein
MISKIIKIKIISNTLIRFLFGKNKKLSILNFLFIFSTQCIAKRLLNYLLILGYSQRCVFLQDMKELKIDTKTVLI